MGVDGGRPKKPVLAAAAIAGAVLIAVPLLLVGGAKDKDDKPDTTQGLAAKDSGTLLDEESAGSAPEDYVTEKPSPSPSQEKEEKKEKEEKEEKEEKKAEAPVKPALVASEVSPKPESEPSSKPEKTVAPAEDKPEVKKEVPKPEWTTETITAPSTLEVGQAWTTNRVRMVLQRDGNLVVYDNQSGKAVWASMMFGKNHRAVFQADGNLVVYNPQQPVWASKTHGNDGAKLVLRSDGKVVIMNGNTVVWST
ncbi:hypothetical protein A4U61_00530 [Streptomyces sp. H-KF8]|nr:hypothetical protein A4U61_00530 [Streptomyces sp. H-KF8]